ncbi:MAG TPA: flavoprotein [Burkholderiaceae bacterium]|nr:flavoprotein [Burkholderiaceae bacterium]
MATERKETRLAWAITGSGHFLDESLQIARSWHRARRDPSVPDADADAGPVDIFLTAAAEEVLQMYGLPVEQLRKEFRVLRDNTASSVPVGQLYDGQYHTLVIAPATSNTVAKCVAGISDSLATNMFAQAGKCRIPSIVFACDAEPTVTTRAPGDWVTLYPRRVDLHNTERLAQFEYTTVVTSVEGLQRAMDRRLRELGAGT